LGNITIRIGALDSCYGTDLCAGHHQHQNSGTGKRNSLLFPVPISPDEANSLILLMSRLGPRDFFEKLPVIPCYSLFPGPDLIAVPPIFRS
jgi:hypothetical protein